MAQLTGPNLFYKAKFNTLRVESRFVCFYLSYKLVSQVWKLDYTEESAWVLGKWAGDHQNKADLREKSPFSPKVVTPQTANLSNFSNKTICLL